MPKPLILQYPMMGKNTNFAATTQPSFTSPRMNNARPRDVLEYRARGGQRPGWRKAYNQHMGFAEAGGILTLRPNADGDLSELIPLGAGDHYVEVDEATSDGDTTRVGNISKVYKKDLFGIPDHTSESGIINSVKVNFRLRGHHTGDPDTDVYGKACIKIGGTEFEGDEETNATESYVLYSKTWTTNPKTGIAWTWSDIDNLQIGVALKGGNDAYVFDTQVWAEVYYMTVVPVCAICQVTIVEL